MRTDALLAALSSRNNAKAAAGASPAVFLENLIEAYATESAAF